MTAETTALFLNATRKLKKDEGYYYTISILDNDDKSYTMFVNEELYNSLEKLNLKKFESIIVTLHIYAAKSGGYNFSPTEIDRVPFKNDLAEKQNPSNSKKAGW